jgi:hypothetical protein
MRNITAIGIACLFTSACGAPKLTESTGRDLLSQPIRNANYVVSLTAVSPLMNHTQIDYSTTNNQGGPAILRQLMLIRLFQQTTIGCS